MKTTNPGRYLALNNVYKKLDLNLKYIPTSYNILYINNTIDYKTIGLLVSDNKNYSSKWSFNYRDNYGITSGIGIAAQMHQMNNSIKKIQQSNDLLEKLKNDTFVDEELIKDFADKFNKKYNEYKKDE